ncbi:MAG: sigma-54 dependent transcriptional regulator, partial [Gammaproteobacteria bacterium]
KTAVRAMQAGAFHYLTKPIDREELVLVVRRALETSALVSEVRELRRQATPAAALRGLMGPSEQIAQVIEQVEQVAPSDLTVLILGETGTGKELVAQVIHRQSARAARPLIAVDCGAIPETLLESELFGYEKGAFTGAERKWRGQFQLADGGTLFLDETANLPPALQPKLLRVLESRQLQLLGGAERATVDVRLVAATNVALHEQVRQGRFREDLYFRLAQFPIRLPPLRDRPGDVPHLVQRFVGEICLELKRPVAEVSAAALHRLQAHRWPGNVRELRNVIRQAVVRCSSLSIDDELIEPLLAHTGLQDTLPPMDTALADASLQEIAERATRAAERRAICAVLREVGGNKSAAAKKLRTDYKTLHTKIKRYTIQPADYS